jgi:hypothetical protein
VDAAEYSNDDQTVGDGNDEHPNHYMDPVLKVLLHHRLYYQDSNSSPGKQMQFYMKCFKEY